MELAQADTHTQTHTPHTHSENTHRFHANEIVFIRVENFIPMNASHLHTLYLKQSSPFVTKSMKRTGETTHPFMNCVSYFNDLYAEQQTRAIDYVILNMKQKKTNAVHGVVLIHANFELPKAGILQHTNGQPRTICTFHVFS